MFILALMIAFVYALPALANPACAVCTIAVGASLEIARRLGVDDSVIGVWLGAILVLMAYWTIKFCDNKSYKFKGRDPLIFLLTFSLVGFLYIDPLTYHAEAILLFYIDPFLFSTIIGGLIFIYSSKLYQWMKAKNGGHAHFPFEKVVLPVLCLALASAYFTYFPLCQEKLPVNILLKRL